MRLLDASTLKLINKHENELPPYAILSHTWGNDEDEVTLQEMQSITTSSSENYSKTNPVLLKTGFAKIRKTADMALSQGLQFIWVDTCCIDKTSSAELSEAINSMFRWYQKSAVCYALLSDVEGSSNLGIVSISDGLFCDESFIKALRSSRWFRRGWTLQELIAPSTVQFFSRDWSLLGTKKDKNGLQDLISDITNISTEILDGSRPLMDLSIANRMKWASVRVTTRSEDLAYCLMGIFDVNMPLLYGEGMKAFIRLQEEILKVNNDQSLFVWKSTVEHPGPVSGLSGLLAPSPACFKNSGQFNPLPPDTSVVSTPSAMTNLGLQVRFNMSPAGIDSFEFNALLDCSPYNTGHEHSGKLYRAAIRLIALGGNQYARLLSDQIFDIPTYKIETRTDYEYREVFVKSQPILLLPNIVLMDYAALNSLGFQLITGWPQGQWNPVTQRIRPALSQREVIVACFRFGELRQQYGWYPNIGGFISYLDIFVGFSVATKGAVSWTTWCDWQKSDISETLEYSVSQSQARMLYSAKKVALLYGRASYPEIIFKVARDRQQGHVFLTVEKIYEVAASVPRPINYDLRLTQYARLAAPLAIGESASIDLSSLYSSTYAIRVRQQDGLLVSQQTLDTIRVGLSTSLDDMSFLKPNLSRPDAFENYFSKLLVKLCIIGNAKTVRELVCSPLSTVLINAWTLEVQTSIEGFDPLNLLKGFRPLHWATLFNCLSTVDVLLKYGADVAQETETGLTALHLAIVMGHLEIFKHIVTVEQSSNHSNHSNPLSQVSPCDTVANFASSFVRSKQVSYILDTIATIADSGGLEFLSLKPNALGETVLHRASATDNIYAVNWAIRRNPWMVNFRDRSGRTPLFHVAVGGSFEICRLLIAKGAVVNTKDSFGRTPLHAACRHGHHKLVNLLYPTQQLHPDSFNISSISDLPFNVWHYASLSKSRETLRALRTCMNAYDFARSRISDETHDDVITPLHIASSNGALECVKIMCDEGFNTMAKSKYTIVSQTLDTGKLHIEVEESDVAKTAMEWAVITGHSHVANYLRGVQEKDADKTGIAVGAHSR